MMKSELAKQLRDRQIQAGYRSSKVINSISDDDMIECYVICPCCGEKQADGALLEELIKISQCSHHFFEILDSINGSH